MTAAGYVVAWFFVGLGCYVLCLAVIVSLVHNNESSDGPPDFHGGN